MVNSLAWTFSLLAVAVADDVAAVAAAPILATPSVRTPGDQWPRSRGEEVRDGVVCK